jgi:branched-chain amino acid transport system permease protein
VLTLNLAVSGLAIGVIAALIGVGLVACYQLTGVFNLGFGGVATLVAYLLWQAVARWHWPLWLAAPLVVLVIAPAIGWFLDAAVFRPLHRRGASEAERLVAALGVLILCVGIAYLIWGADARLDAPQLFPVRPLELPGGIHTSTRLIYQLVVLVAVSGLVIGVTRWTELGTAMRAVVDRPELTELAGVDSDRLSAIGSAFGSFLAGLAGVLLAPQLRLDPIQPTLVVLETMVVAVAATLARPVVAVTLALLLGIAQSELTQLHASGIAGAVLRASQGNLFVVALLATVLILPRILPPSDDATDRFRVTARLMSDRRGAREAAAVVILLLLPLGFDPADLRTALLVPGLAIVFVSLVAVSGLAGQISLGQAGYAGLGGLFCAALTTPGGIPGMPAVSGLAAIVIGALLVIPVGLLTGWPAIRRRGLALALTTFALATVVSRFVFAQPAFTAGLRVRRPEFFASDRGFYGLELMVLALAVLAVWTLRRGRVGRTLVAIRDDEIAARACGVEVSRLKVQVFAVGSLIAGFGGALLVDGAQSFDAASFDPIQGLIWFGAVVVFGADDLLGAILAAALLVGIDAGITTGAAAALVGVLALLLGRMPGGVLATLGRFVAAGAAPTPQRSLRLTERGRQVAALAARRRTP